MNKHIIKGILFFVILLSIFAECVLADAYTGWINECTGSEPNTMACWSFNQSTLGTDANGHPTAADLSGNGYTATLYSNPAGVVEFAVGGKWDYGVHMTSAGGSDDYVIAADGTKTMFTAGQSMSAECWVKFDDLMTSQFLIDKQYTGTGASQNTGFGIKVTRNVDVNRIWFYLGDNTVITNIYQDVSLETGRYYHIAMTWDTTDAAHHVAKIFLDGALIKTSGTSLNTFNAVFNNSRAIRIAQRQSSSYQPLTGTIDSVRISNKAHTYTLPPSPAPANPYYGWVNEYTGGEPNTMACWSFNQDTISSTDAADISGHGYTATLSSIPVGVVSYADGGKWDYGVYMTSVGDANDYVQTPDSSKNMFGADQSLSVECWVKFDDLTGTQVLIDKKYTDTGAYYTGFQIKLTENGSLNRLWLSLGDGSQTYQSYVDLEWETGRYYHIAATWDAYSDVAKMYRDGVLVKSSTFPGAAMVFNNNYKIRIAQRLGGSYQPLKGFIDMVRISNVAYKFAVWQPPAPVGPYEGWKNEETVDDATIGLWHWNEETGDANNAVPQGPALKPYGSAAFSEEGKFGNGGDCPDAGINTLWRTSGFDMDASVDDSNLSVAMWIKPTYLPWPNSSAFILDKGYITNSTLKAGYILRIFNSDEGIITLRAHIGTASGAVIVSAGADLVEGQWTHIAFVWDAAQDVLKLYQDGRLLGASISPGSVYVPSIQGLEGVTAYTLRVGQRQGSAYGGLMGIVDDLKISNIAVEYADGVVPVCPQGDISGPDGVPDCNVDIYDIALLADQWLIQTTSPSFFTPALDYSVGYDNNKVYPQGKILGFSFYSIYNPDIYGLKANGFTAIGPYYDANQINILNIAEALDLKYHYRIGMDLDPDSFVLPSDAEIQVAITAQVNAVKDSNAIACWYVVPEELHTNNADQMHYMQVVTAAARAADSVKDRPVWEYQANAATDDELEEIVPYLDICAKGMYCNRTGHQTERIYCKWAIEQEKNAIAAENPSAIPLAMPEMMKDPCSWDAEMLPVWTKHDVYSALVTGAKGVVVFSGYRRAELANYWDEYYDGYATVAAELNGPMNLGQVFLFGERKTDITVNITSGPTTVSITDPEAYTAPSVNYANIKDKTGARYLFLVNSANSSVGVNVSGLPTEKIYRCDMLESDAFTSMTGGGFSATLEGLAVKCYKFVKSPADISGSTGIADGKVNFFDFVEIAESWMDSD